MPSGCSSCKPWDCWRCGLFGRIMTGRWRARTSAAIAAEVAHAWLLHQPAVATVIAGSRTVAQLESAVNAVGLDLDAATLAELDRLWPGPGEAPESYSCQSASGAEEHVPTSSAQTAVRRPGAGNAKAAVHRFRGQISPRR